MGERVILRTRDASFGPRGRTVLSRVDLALPAGRLVAVLGANGSGKSTLLRGLIGLDPPLAGTVERPRGPIGFVPQRDSLDPLYPANVYEVVQMGAAAQRTRVGALPAARRRAVSDQLQCVGLASLGRTPFAALSGGQRQRVLIARALVADAPILALDEPTSGADDEAEESILALLAAEAEAKGRLVLVVAHRASALTRHTDHALHVRNGTVRQASLASVVRGDER